MTTKVRKAPVLTDRKALVRNRECMNSDRSYFFHDIAKSDLQDRIDMVNRRFTRIAIVTGAVTFWQKAFPDAEVVEDCETLNLAPQSYDLVIHTMCLHWANDSVGQMIQCRFALKPDGLFLLCCFGGQTLAELRAALATAESKMSNGISPRILPMADIRDLGALLQRAGFALPVADTLPLKLEYRALRHLYDDLKHMGERNALNDRRKCFSRRAIFVEAEEIYKRTNPGDTGILASFELMFLTGWAPSENQPKALRPGSATQRLSDALGTEETPL